MPIEGVPGYPGYNSLENPIGIETIKVLNVVTSFTCYNSLENPIGIETTAVGARRRSENGVTTH